MKKSTRRSLNKQIDGETLTIKTNHSMSDEQIEWFKAGSALNLLGKKLTVNFF